MQRAEAGVCSPLDGRCHAFYDRVQDDLDLLRPDDLCKIGWLMRSGRDA
jgi:hypothetical protein